MTLIIESPSQGEGIYFIAMDALNTDLLIAIISNNDALTKIT